MSQGYTAAYFKEVLVTSTSYQGPYTWSFISAGIYLFNEGTALANVCFYSFDGNVDHGNLIPTTQVAGILFPNRHEDTVWLRLASGAAPVTVRIESWE